MENAIDQPAQQTDRWLKDNHPPTRRQHAPKFLQGAAGKLQMMPHIEQDQIRNRTIGETQGVGIFYLIHPGIRNQVCAQTILNHGLHELALGTGGCQQRASLLFTIPKWTLPGLARQSHRNLFSLHPRQAARVVPDCGGRELSALFGAITESAGQYYLWRLASSRSG